MLGLINSEIFFHHFPTFSKRLENDLRKTNPASKMCKMCPVRGPPNIWKVWIKYSHLKPWIDLNFLKVFYTLDGSLTIKKISNKNTTFLLYRGLWWWLVSGNYLVIHQSAVSNPSMLHRTHSRPTSPPLLPPHTPPPPPRPPSPSPTHPPEQVACLNFHGNHSFFHDLTD